jgi:hypothetical protein
MATEEYWYNVFLQQNVSAFLNLKEVTIEKIDGPGVTSTLGTVLVWGCGDGHSFLFC